MNKLKITWSVRTECGPERKKNEDSVFPVLSGNKYLPFRAAICDGLGGHVDGEVASKIAAESMSDDEDNVLTIIEKANKKIVDYQKNHSNSEGMGTTMTALIINEDGLMQVGHVGDSRCYVLSDRNIIKITDDQNVPGFKNVLKQALGTKDKLDIQKIDFQLNNGDVILLCTDGLYNEFGEEYIKKRLKEGVTADTLVSEALLQIPSDNVSAIIMNVFSK
tara:strand:- start:1452 stop:2111 length:660 start_codon:yes stop_codon:yes gene_type:complete